MSGIIPRRMPSHDAEQARDRVRDGGLDASQMHSGALREWRTQMLYDYAPLVLSEDAPDGAFSAWVSLCAQTIEFRREAQS